MQINSCHVSSLPLQWLPLQDLFQEKSPQASGAMIFLKTWEQRLRVLLSLLEGQQCKSHSLWGSWCTGWFSSHLNGYRYLLCNTAFFGDSLQLLDRCFVLFHFTKKLNHAICLKDTAAMTAKGALFLPSGLGQYRIQTPAFILSDSKVRSRQAAWHNEPVISHLWGKYYRGNCQSWLVTFQICQLYKYLFCMF